MVGTIQYQDDNTQARVEYDTQEFPFYDMFLDHLQKKHPNVKRLEDIHKHIEMSEFVDVRHHFLKWMVSKEYSQIAETYVAKHLAPHVCPNQEYMLQAIPMLRMVPPNQLTSGYFLMFHTGTITGYPTGVDTIWTPITRAYDSNTMHMVNRADSDRISKLVNAEQWSVKRWQKECEDLCFPVTIEKGQAWLFKQYHWHGNVNNETDITRWSWDMRTLKQGSIIDNSRRPGSYFRFPNDYHETPALDPKRKWSVYVDQTAEEWCGTIPHYIVREWVWTKLQKMGVTPTSWNNEHFTTTWNPNLEHHICHSDIKGLALPSIYSLRAEITRKFEMFKMALERDVHLYFPAEEILMDSQSKLDKIQRILEFTNSGN